MNVVLRIQGLILRTIEAVHWQKIKNTHSQLKIYWFFKTRSKTWVKINLLFLCAFPQCLHRFLIDDFHHARSITHNGKLTNKPGYISHSVS